MQLDSSGKQAEVMQGERRLGWGWGIGEARAGERQMQISPRHGAYKIATALYG